MSSLTSTPETPTPPKARIAHPHLTRISLALACIALLLLLGVWSLPGATFATHRSLAMLCLLGSPLAMQVAALATQAAQSPARAVPHIYAKAPDISLYGMQAVSALSAVQVFATVSPAMRAKILNSGAITADQARVLHAALIASPSAAAGRTVTPGYAAALASLDASDK